MRADKHKLNSSGIEIAPPLLIESGNFVAADAALSLLLILLGVFGSVWCFISAFSLPILPLTVILYTLLFSFVFTLTFYLKRACYPIVFVLALLYGAAIWYGRTPFVRGFIITTNQIMDDAVSISSRPISGDEVILIITPLAPLIAVSRSGLEIAILAAFSALSLPEALPTPIWA